MSEERLGPLESINDFLWVSLHSWVVAMLAKNPDLQIPQEVAFLPENKIWQPMQGASTNIYFLSF